MSNLSDLPINEVGNAARVYTNDVALSTYLQNVTHRDKKSPWSVWTETYSVPYFGKFGADSFYATFSRLPYVSGKVTEPHGRRFLGGSVFVARSARIGSNVDFEESQFQVNSSSGDQVIVHMVRNTSQNAYKLAPFFSPDVDDFQQYITDKAEKIQDSQASVWLCKPRLYSNDPTVTNYSLELPVDSNYIGKDEYWMFFIEPCNSTGAASDVGWQGVTINLRFAALLEE